MTEDDHALTDPAESLSSESTAGKKLKRDWASTLKPAAIGGAIVLVIALVTGTIVIQDWRDYSSQIAEDRDAARAKLETIKAERDSFESELLSVQGSLARTKSELSSLTGRSDELAALEAELASREAALDEREAEIEATEATIAANTFGPGTYLVGTDIEPGTYRTTDAVGGYCYWGIYAGGTNQEDIIQNDIVTGGRPTVTLSSGQEFDSNRCGTWTKVD